MKKLLPLLALIVVAAIAFYLINSSTSLSTISKTATSSPSQNTHTEPPTNTGSTNDAGQPRNTGAGSAVGSLPAGAEEGEDMEIKPALEAYKNATDALNAIKNGATEYDDRILEQFTEMPEDCTWCKELYAEIKDLMLAPQTPKEQRSYYAELLAISGKVDNVAMLIDSIKNAPNQETQDALSEALELTVGKNEVTQYLGDQLGGASDTLKESIIAAVTNQGSRLSAEILYKATVEKGDPDGYYSSGIGLGELVPDESTMPYLQELMLKKDQYSHLAAKALANNGLDGLKLIMNSLSSSSNREMDEKIIKGLAEHVPVDDDMKSYLEPLAQTEKDPIKLKLINEILEISKGDEVEDASGNSDTESEDAAPEAEQEGE